MKHFLLIGLTLLLATGCAPRIQLADPTLAPRIWAALNPEAPPIEQLTAHFSLHVQTPKRTGRLLGHLWGYSHALRLDLSSGTGGAVALIRETPELWIAYLPTENKAYHHVDARAGLALFSIPVPFTTHQMSSLLTGDFRPILTHSYSQVQETSDGKIRFTFARGDVATLETTEDLDILIFHGKKGWTLTCEKPYEAPGFTGLPLYEKFTFDSMQDGLAVLRVKSLENSGTWDTSDLELRLPQNVQWMRLGSDASLN